MKKLYRKGAVHPSPSLKPDHLSFLPATILTLTVALSPEDREVLAYLISCSSSSNFSSNRRKNTSTTSASASASASNNSNNGNSSGNSSGVADHPPSFNCYCFGCYTSYWVRWDSSPNRQLIHEIIDAYEQEGSSMQISKKEKSRKERRKGKKGSGHVDGSAELKGSPSNKECITDSSENSVQNNSVEEEEVISTRDNGDVGDNGKMEEEEISKGSVRRFVSFVGEKIWGVWT